MATFDIRRELILRDVEWALSVGITRCQRSSFGQQLEHAKNYGYDSNDPPRRIPKIPANSWEFMKVKRSFTEPAYEIEFSDVFRIGKVQRWLRAVDAVDPKACDAILAMYGDCGSRWGRDPILYQLTKSGRKLIARVRARGGQAAEMSDFEILAQEEHEQTMRPQKRRGQAIEAMKTEALELKSRAIKLLVRCAK